MKQGGIASALFDNNAFAKLGPKSRTHRFRDPWHRGKGPRILLCYRDLEFESRAWITEITPLYLSISRASRRGLGRWSRKTINSNKLLSTSFLAQAPLRTARNKILNSRLVFFELWTFRLRISD